MFSVKDVTQIDFEVGRHKVVERRKKKKERERERISRSDL